MRKISILMLVLSLSFGCGGAMAEGKRFVVGVENIDHYPHYTLQDGAWSGFGRDVLDAFAKDRGYAFMYRPYPVKRLMQKNWHQEVDLMFPDNPLWFPEKKKDVAITYSTNFVEVLEGTLVPPERLGDGIANITILGTITGFTVASYNSYIEKGHVKLDHARDSRYVLLKVLDGRTDAAFMAVDSANYVLSGILNKPGALVFDPSLPYDNYAYYLSSVKRPDLIKEFDQFVAQHPDLIVNLKQKYKMTSGL